MYVVPVVHQMSVSFASVLGWFEGLGGLAGPMLNFCITSLFKGCFLVVVVVVVVSLFFLDCLGHC